MPDTQADLRDLIETTYGPEGSTADQAALKRLVEALDRPVSEAITKVLPIFRQGFRHFGGQPEAAYFKGAVFEKLLRARGDVLRQWDWSRRFGPFLNSIARVVVADGLRELRGRREMKREVERMDPGELDELTTNEDVAQRLASRDELARVVRALYASAPEREISVFELHFLRELSVSEVAAILELSENGVSQAIRRLRARVATVLESGTAASSIERGGQATKRSRG